MRLIVMATGPFSVPMFKALLKATHSVVALVTRPDRTTEGRAPPVNPARTVAEEAGIPVLTPERINSPEAIEALRALAPELLVVCDYGQILSAEALSTARLGGINLHGSLLPKYRGAAPVQWAILRGESETGVTVIHMDPRLDAGPILAQSRLTIGPDETADALEARLAQLGAELVPPCVAELGEWDGVRSIGIPQDPALVSKAPRFRKEDARLDWTRSAQELHNQVRGLQPWPGAVTEYVDTKGRVCSLRIMQSRVVDAAVPNAVPPGSLHGDPLGQLRITTARGLLELRRVRPAGRGEVSGEDFLRGARLPAGVRFR